MLQYIMQLKHKSNSPSKHKTFVQHLYNVGQRLRRWSNIVQMLYKCFVFAGYCSHGDTTDSTIFAHVYIFSVIRFASYHDVVWKQQSLRFENTIT